MHIGAEYPDCVVTLNGGGASKIEAMQRPADMNRAKRRKAAFIRHGILVLLRAGLPPPVPVPAPAPSPLLAPRDLLSSMRSWILICGGSLFFFSFFSFSFFFFFGWGGNECRRNRSAVSSGRINDCSANNNDIFFLFLFYFFSSFNFI